jgi:hypothetical protein
LIQRKTCLDAKGADNAAVLTPLPMFSSIPT